MRGLEGSEVFVSWSNFPWSSCMDDELDQWDGDNDELVPILSNGNDQLLVTSHAQVNTLNPA